MLEVLNQIKAELKYSEEEAEKAIGPYLNYLSGEISAYKNSINIVESYIQQVEKQKELDIPEPVWKVSKPQESGTYTASNV